MNLALSLVRYRYRKSLVDAGWLFEPDDETVAALYADTWERDAETLSCFVEAIAWNLPRTPPTGRDANRLPYKLPNPVPAEVLRAEIEKLLDGDDVRSAIEASSTRGTDEAARGGSEHAAFVLVSELVHVSVNTVRECHREWHGQDRVALKKLLTRQAAIYQESGLRGLGEHRAELDAMHRRTLRRSRTND